jgi:hypothetical protein
MATCSDRAWNNFVLLAIPASQERGSNKRAAAIANLFMGLANNGGLNAFLTSSHDLEADEVLDALTSLGATDAASQLDAVLEGLGAALPASSAEDRWRRLDEHWTDDLDQYDVLTNAADEQLRIILERHVAANEDFYFSPGEQ